MPRKLSLFKGRKSSRSSNTPSSSDTYENQENVTSSRSLLSLHREDRLFNGMCGSDNSSGAAEESPSSKDRNTENQASGPEGPENTILDLQEFKETQIQQQKCLQNLRVNYYRDYTMIMQALKEERSSKDILTKELADFTELYQNETQNLKEELDSTKEMIKYLVYKTTTDIHEVLGALQYRVVKLEEQQLQQQMEKKPKDTILEKIQNIPLAIWSSLLLFLSTLGYFVMSLKT